MGVRLDNVGVVVNDMEAAVAFFEELGLEVEGRATVEGEWVDRVDGLQGTRADIVMLHTSDGHGRLELTRYHHPPAVGADPRIEPPNTRGMGRVMFAVDDIDDTVERLHAHGGELVGEIVQYRDIYRLCYLRGPEGIILGLSQELARG
jgi:catechol 2,3-dioxygenase-like lactoylglutathione lyase family enzyme